MLFNSPPISFTDKALTEINFIIKEKNIPPDYGLRIGKNGGGCSEVSYFLGFDKMRADDDIYNYHGLSLYMNKKDIMFIVGMVIDFEETAELRGFVFNNPS